MLNNFFDFIPITLHLQECMGQHTCTILPPTQTAALWAHLTAWKFKLPHLRTDTNKEAAAAQLFFAAVLPFARCSAEVRYWDSLLSLTHLALAWQRCFPTLVLIWRFECLFYPLSFFSPQFWLYKTAWITYLEMCLSWACQPGPDVGYKDTLSLSEGGCGTGLRPTVEQRRTPWSHSPKFSHSNTTLYVCEKRGASLCIRVSQALFLHRETGPGSDLCPHWVQFIVFALALNKAFLIVLLQSSASADSPWHRKMTLHSADLEST